MCVFLCFVFLFNVFCVNSWGSELKKRVDVVSYSEYLFSDKGPIKYNQLKEEFDLLFTFNLYRYVDNFSGDDPKLQKIIFFDYCQDPKTINLPKNKLICFKWEAIKIPLCFYHFYYRVYTFDDDLVDREKFFKFYYPVLQPMLPYITPFIEKKFCSIVVKNWIPERIKILDFFATKPKNSLDIYGHLPTSFFYHEMYKGEISGGYSSQEKLNLLKNYRFCICFENVHTTPGYITEKIFDAFAAGCVPIYWGPENVEDYIPIDCFIDYRKFKNNEEMYQFITSITESEYELYIDNIRHFLQSEQASLFSQENFEKLLYEAVLDPQPLPDI
ncbi:MAG: hypothetical protein K940chlam6_00782 [Chlamydiae bacterium]|nr:hypothetical protein [Chlamydiota bacterium]